MAQAIAGLVIVAAALRDSIPGRTLSRGTVATIIAGGLVLPSVVLLLTASGFDIGPGAGERWAHGRPGCGRPKSGAGASWPIATMPRRMARVLVRSSDAMIVWAEHVGLAFGESAAITPLPARSDGKF